MEVNEVGNMLQTLRNKQNIAQHTLCRGVCSVSHLSRLESGERTAEMLLLETLFQRMGKSPDKIEMLLTERDYLLYGLRMQIELALLRKDYEMVKMQIAYYEEEKEAENPLHKQYLFEIKAILEMKESNDMTASCNYLKKAIALTIPNFSLENIEGYLLSIREIQLILLLAHNLPDTNQKGIIKIVRILESYIDKHYTDEEEKVKIYPKAVYVLVKKLLKAGHNKEAEYLCNKAIDYLVLSGVTTCLIELMELGYEALKRNLHVKEALLIKKEMDSLKAVYQEYQIPVPDGESNIWVENTQREVHLLHELIKRNRKNRGITQESLTNNIQREQETLSRIETGKRAPSRKTFESIKRELGIDRTYYMGYISSIEFEVHENKREISKFISLRKYKEAERIFKRIRMKLLNSSKENHQYELYMTTVLNLRLNRINAETAIIRFKSALSDTQKDFFDRGVFNGILTRQEVFILNNIAICLNQSGNRKEAILVLRRVLEEYNDSGVDLVFHSVGAILTMSNLCSYLEEEKLFDEAIEICDKGINLSLQCGRGNLIGEILTTKACAVEQGKKKEASKDYFKQAYFISKLMKYKVTCHAIDAHYRDSFNEKIK